MLVGGVAVGGGGVVWGCGEGVVVGEAEGFAGGVEGLRGGG